MNLELGVKLVALALVDSTSVGTLVIPIWFLLTPGRVRAERVMLYLGIVASSYAVFGVLLMVSGHQLLDRLGTAWASGPGGVVVLALGAVMLAIGVVMPSNNSGKPGRVVRRLGAWRDTVIDVDGGGGMKAVIFLAFTAVILEAAAMLPYLAAIGMLSAASTSPLARTVWLLGYCGVMVAPADLLLVGRVLVGGRIQPLLERVGAWLERTSGETTAWIIALVGLVLVRSAWEAGARPPWM